MKGQSKETEHNQTSKQLAETNEVNQLITTLLDDANQLQVMYKNWVSTVKKLTKEMEREKKRIAKHKPKRTVKQNPQKVTKEMQSFMKKFIRAMNI